MTAGKFEFSDSRIIRSPDYDSRTAEFRRARIVWYVPRLVTHHPSSAPAQEPGNVTFHWSIITRFGEGGHAGSNTGTVHMFPHISCSC